MHTSKIVPHFGSNFVPAITDASSRVEADLKVYSFCVQFDYSCIDYDRAGSVPHESC